MHFHYGLFADPATTVASMPPENADQSGSAPRSGFGSLPGARRQKSMSGLARAIGLPQGSSEILLIYIIPSVRIERKLDLTSADGSNHGQTGT
jgi:hypothetical protein